MIHSQHRTYSIIKKLIYQSIIKIKSLIIYMSGMRNNSRPGNRKSVRIKPDFFHQCNIIFIKMIMVACNISIISIGNFSFFMRKHIPDRRSLSITIMCSLNLICCSCCTKNKILLKPNGSRQVYNLNFIIRNNFIF